jgi:hypothetical protein
LLPLHRQPINRVVYAEPSSCEAKSILAKVPEAFERREASENDLVARNSDVVLEERNSPETMFSREDDTASLQEREPSPFFGALIGVAARVGGRIAARAGARHANHRAQNRRRRDLEPEDELDLASREDMDELTERELDMIEREFNEDDILEREVEDELYLD